MGKLSDILRDGQQEKLSQRWDETEAAEDFGLLPAGEYVARIVSGELFTSRTNGTPGYKLEFQVLEGDYAERRFWLDVWLTEAALPMAKRDLGKLGVTSLAQLEQPLPAGIRCRVKLAVRKDDDGNEFNRVRSFEVVGLDEPEPDAFAPESAANATDGEDGDGQGDDESQDAEAEAAGEGNADRPDGKPF